ncbi:MAG: hypothetical protein LBP67_06480 [Bacteroidales bacterium]|jgi:hypothetical protein|nr:hypothetical protein [Bacteroidales bacterium]
MKNKINIKTIITLMVITIPFIFQSCIMSSRIIQESDVVYSTKRVSFRHTTKDRNRKTPLLYLDQTFVKEIKGNKETYRVYDALNLASRGFKLDDKVFLIADGEIFNINIENKEYEFSRRISENKSDVMTADSTTISVVTGFSEDNRKITRFSYKLTDDMVSKIRNSNQIIFRYYAGPSMISVKLRNNDLKKLKKLIEIR